MVGEVRESPREVLPTFGKLLEERVNVLAAIFVPAEIEQAILHVGEMLRNAVIPATPRPPRTS